MDHKPSLLRDRYKVAPHGEISVLGNSQSRGKVYADGRGYADRKEYWDRNSVQGPGINQIFS